MMTATNRMMRSAELRVQYLSKCDIESYICVSCIHVPSSLSLFCICAEN